MSWISDIFGGDPTDGTGEEVPRERRLVERALQLCHGTRSAARAVPSPHGEVAGEAEDLAARLLERLEPVKERMDAATPGTIASAQGVANPGTEVPSAEEVPAIPDRELERAVELLGQVHFDLIRLKVQGLAPGDVDLEEELERLHELLEGEMPERLLASAETADGGGDDRADAADADGRGERAAAGDAASQG